MLEKDTLQFHNQGTQVEHAVSILGSELPPELQPPLPPTTEEIETVLITEETVEAVQAVSEGAMATLSDQSIMQVVNYVLAQQAVVKVEEEPEIIQTMEVEVAHVAEVEWDHLNWTWPGSKNYDYGQVYSFFVVICTLCDNVKKCSFIFVVKCKLN